ncbi:MAG: hypothetical protein KDC54_02020 [Lewinella sp.]|nr:hypothetical protein [Lewinella sp.]
MNKVLSLLAGLFLLSSWATAQTLTGTTILPDQTPICDVLVNLYDDQGSLVDQDLTNAAGQFAFNGLTAGADYRLEFVKEGASLNGVSTFDIVKTAKHILGLEILPDYAIWAADVNNSNTISTYDLVVSRRLILGLDSDLPADNWRFGAVGTISPNNQIPISNLPATLTIDVIGVKVGDVNFSVFPCQ